jgi:hypothetical protein
MTLADWSSFYVIIGSAAGGLTGLTFVVIALAADAYRRVSTDGLHAFLTPTIVHFGTVLALAAYLSVPRQSAVSLSVGFGATGVMGLIYSVVIAVRLRRMKARYVAVYEDWICNVIMPALAYGALLAMAFLGSRQLEHALYGVAAALLLLLFIGIRNAWDIAVWNSVQRKPDER